MDAQPALADNRHAGQGQSGAPPAALTLATLIEQLIGFALRQYRVFVLITSGALGLGLIYLFATPPLYTATATLLIDSSKLRGLQSPQQAGADLPIDAAQIESQVEVLRSVSIANSVIKALDLADSPEFGKASAGLFAALRGLLGGSEVVSQEEREHRALAAFASRRQIGRVGKTYALDISFTSLDPGRAATIANAIAEAYIVDQLEAKYQAVRRASIWLQDRIKELRAQASAADRAVLEYKESKNIVDVGGASAGSGSSRLVGEQQLSELNTQLVNARVATNEAKARLDRIEQVLKLDVGEATVADTLRNDVITRLRNQYLDLAAREATWSARYGHEHQAAINLRTQMDEVRRNIADELGRVAASYRSDYEIARIRQDNLERSFADLISEGQATNRDRLALIELESNAKIYRTIYDSFLQRYTEALQQQSFPITEARVISAAAAPKQKSKPVTTLVLAVAGTLGLLVSFAVAALREAVDGAFRTARQVEDALGVSCISVLPMTKPEAVEHGAARRAKRAPGSETADAGAPPEGTPATPRRHYAFADLMMRRVVDKPLSAFAEGLRAVKITAELRGAFKENKVIGITSTVPGEGKSTVASNLAELIADAGKRAILVDADLRNPTLAHALQPRPSVGLMDVLTRTAELDDVIGFDPGTGLAFLPVLRNQQAAHFDEVLSSQGFRDLVDELCKRYDYVIVDLPPLAPVIDVRAAIQSIHSIVFVIEWGATKIKLVQSRLASEPEVYDRLLGAVLNKADLKMIDRFEHHGRYHSSYHARYGYLD
ncbi:MAG TPA: AAA family ATPase [Xanthobacteraceae bacterium]|nr:AAA family ATPase [Xanthobacteraceae bacterium]